MTVLQMVGSAGSSNETEIELLDPDGAPFNLDTLNATRLIAYVCGAEAQPSCGNKTIEGTWQANVATFQWGDFGLLPGTYHPLVKFYTAADPDGQVIIGPGYPTVIRLKFTC